MKTKILQIDRNDKDAEEKELDFEVKWQMSLTTAQRFKKMFEVSLFMLKRLKKNGLGKAPHATQRA